MPDHEIFELGGRFVIARLDQAQYAWRNSRAQTLDVIAAMGAPTYDTAEEAEAGLLRVCAQESARFLSLRNSTPLTDRERELIALGAKRAEESLARGRIIPADSDDIWEYDRDLEGIQDIDPDWARDLMRHGWARVIEQKAGF
jgi:hypothetical protein